MKAGKSGSTEEVFEIKYDASHPLESLANEKESTSLGSKVHDVAGQDTECNCMPFIFFFFFPFSFVSLLQHNFLLAASGPANTEQVLAERNVENKRYTIIYEFHFLNGFE